MPTATLSEKGQTTIPKQVRDYLKIHPGDRIDFELAGQGKVILKPANIDIRDLKGFLAAKTKKHATIDEMNSVIKQRAGSSK